MQVKFPQVAHKDGVVSRNPAPFPADLQPRMGRSEHGPRRQPWDCGERHPSPV